MAKAMNANADIGIPTLYVSLPNPDRYGFHMHFRIVRCFRCPKPAQIFSGHLHFYNPDVQITVGYCRKCHESKNEEDYPDENGCPGCYGKWKPEYGIKIELSAVKKGDAKLRYTHVL